MKIRDLQRQLDVLTKADAKAAEADIVFGPEEGDQVPLLGGIYGRDKAGNGRLILAPIKLDGVGGF
jgi:hypothetical protein